jgi:Cu-Zn family superoxide dismutase
MRWSLSSLARVLLAMACFGAVQARAADEHKHADHQHHQHQHATQAPQVRQLVAVMVPMGKSGVQGVVYFTGREGAVEVSGKITGLTPGKHAFHVHQYGDLTDVEKGLSAGDHFNPEHKPHGRPEDAERHAGDFGNIVADAQGVANIQFTDKVIRLEGKGSILGRSLVVHANEDQFSQPSGNAGPRVAVGVIGVASPKK